jgi:hypothetical protein
LLALFGSFAVALQPIAGFSVSPSMVLRADCAGFLEDDASLLLRQLLQLQQQERIALKSTV